MVYFARPDSCVFDEQVYVCRKQMGWQLAHESTPDVDFVMPFSGFRRLFRGRLCPVRGIALRTCHDP